MQKIAQYDPYAIDQIQFYINKKTKYTNLKSILLTLLILALTVFVSWSSLQNIWCGREALDVFQTQRKLSDSPLTQTAFCVVSKNLGTVAPNSTLNYYKINPSLQLIGALLPTTLYNNNKQIRTITQGRSYYCFNLAGLALNQDYKIQLTIPGSTLIDVLLKTQTVPQVLQQRNDQFFIFNDLPLPGPGDQLLSSNIFRKFKSIVYDNLYVDYEPIVESQTSQNMIRVDLVSPSGTNTSTIVIEILSQTKEETDMVGELVVKRQNIGQILGILF